MLYVQRGADGSLLQVSKQPFDGMTEELAMDSPEAQQWLGLARLRESDQDMIRVLEDLIYTLMDKGVISITDLPAAAQAKLIARGKARDALGEARLFSEDEDIPLF